MLRRLLQQGNQRDLHWLRAQIDGSVVPSPALFKVNAVMRNVGGVDVAMVSPKSSALTTASEQRVIIYFHGGGYVFGSPKSHHGVIAQLAVDSNCLVIAPDYRLAPEHPFPAPQDDCLAVTKAVAKAYPQSQLILAGDSAGGALAIMAALELGALELEQSARAGGSGVKGADRLVLLSPWVDPLASEGTIQSNADNDFLIGPFLAKSYGALMQSDTTISPRVRVLDADLTHLPPTLIQCGDGELFFDQIQAFAEQAEQAGADVTLSNFAGQFHVFQALSPVLKDARRAMQEIARFIVAK